MSYYQQGWQPGQMVGYQSSGWQPRYGAGYQQPVQQQQMQAQQQPVQQMQEQMVLPGREVQSRAEAESMPVDLSGRPVFMPSPSEGRVYIKTFDLSTGQVVLKQYDETGREKPQAGADVLAEMREAMQEMERRLATLERVPMRRRMRETEATYDEDQP